MMMYPPWYTQETRMIFLFEKNKSRHIPLHVFYIRDSTLIQNILQMTFFHGPHANHSTMTIWHRNGASSSPTTFVCDTFSCDSETSVTISVYAKLHMFFTHKSTCTKSGTLGLQVLPLSVHDLFHLRHPRWSWKRNGPLLHLVGDLSMIKLKDEKK